MIRVAREKLLRELESVQPGLAPRGLIQQSSCFVFCEGHVVTFNDEVHCSHQCCLKVTGAVEALPLLGILRQLKEEQVKLWTTKAHLRLKGKGVPYETAGVMGNKSRRGDLLVVTHVLMPKKISKNAQRLIDELKGEEI